VDSETLLVLFRVITGTAVLAFFGVWAFRRARFLVRLTTKVARPNPGRSRANAFKANLRRAAVNIFANRKLLRWTLPGVAHFWVMWEIGRAHV
jgi:hypothetical protein